MLTKDAFTQAAARPSATRSASKRGVPCSLDGKRARRRSSSSSRLEAIGATFGIGRGIHLGDTIIGTKGRVAFEAPAAEVLLTAHRELEKLVLIGATGAHQGHARRALRRPRARGPAPRSGVPRHRGVLLSRRSSASPARCTCCSGRASLFVEGVTSPYSLMTASKGVYGEAAGEWTRRGCARLLEDAGAAGHLLHARRRGSAGSGVTAMQMRTVVVDKIASIAQACGLGHEMRIATSDIPCEEGVVLVVEILNNKSTYNTLELTSGRMAKVVARRRRRRRARPPAGAVRLLGPHPGEGRGRRRASRCSTSAACSASATR